jgi:HK97 family phage prohead protease
MTELMVHRELAATVEPVGDGWTVEGMAVPYGVPHRVTDDGRLFYREGFTGGAFARDAAEGGQWVNLLMGHGGGAERDRWLGRCTSLEDKVDGLWATFRLNRSHPMAEAARSGEITSWSVSAHIYASRTATDLDGPVVWREMASLAHVAATARPQYAGAGVRVAREHVWLTGPPTPRLDALRAKGYGRA